MDPGWLSQFFMVPSWLSWSSLVPGWFFIIPGRFSCFFYGSRLVFHSSRSVFIIFMVPGWFSWFFMVLGWLFMVFSKMYPPKSYPGPTIQSRSAARRAAKDLVIIIIMNMMIILIQRESNHYHIGICATGTWWRASGFKRFTGNSNFQT